MSESLIISWEQQRLVLLSGSVSDSEIRVEKLAVLDWPANTNPRENRQAAGMFLKDALRENGFAANSAFVSLPREAAVLRHLHLPDLPDDELPEIVKLQAATKSSIPADQLLIDFLPLPGKNEEGLRPVMIATIERKNSQVIRETLGAAGLELEGIGVESVGLAEIATRTATADYGKALVAVSLTGNRLEILFLQNDSLLMMHTAVLAEGSNLEKAVVAEINRATIATEQKVNSLTIGSVVLLTGSKFDDSQLQTRYGEHYRAIDLRSTPIVHLSGSIREDGNTTTIGALSGLLLNRDGGRIPGLDFLNPRRKKVVKDDRLRKYGLYAAAGVVVVVLGLYGYYRYRGGLDTVISDLKTKQAGLQETLNQGKPTLKQNADLREWQDRDLDMLGEIDQMQKTLPGTGLAYLEQFNYDVAIGNNIAKYSAKGVATSRDVVEELNADLSKLGFAVDPREIKSGRDPEYPAIIDLTMNRLPKSDNPIPPVTSNQPPQAVKP